MNKKGFTLIEMLVVVLIVSILSYVAFVTYVKFMERMRMAEADMLMGTMVSSQERTMLKMQHYTPYWHQLDAAPIPVRLAKAQNDFANGEENTIFYTRGGVLSGAPKNGFAVSFEQDGANRWFVVARRVGKPEYSYRLVRPFFDTRTVCVPQAENEEDVAMCIDYMGVETAEELAEDPMVPKTEDDGE